MPEDISVQILAQASDNIQKLFDLSTRIDERVKSIQAKQEHLDKRFDDLIHQHMAAMQKIAVLESKEEDGGNVFLQIDSCNKQLIEMDKRLTRIETDQGKQNDRWKGLGNFIIQLVWVVLAAYLLTQLNLQPPAVP